MPNIVKFLVGVLTGVIICLFIMTVIGRAQESPNPCGLEALYAGMIMNERQYNPENREKAEDDFSEAAKQVNSGEKQFSLARMHGIFDKAYAQLQGLDNDEKDKITADFVTEIYNECKASKQ